MYDEIMITVVSVVFILTVGGVILLRPMMKRLGEFLEVLIQDKRRLGGRVTAPSAVNEALEQRISLLEERVEFTERLLRAPADHAGRAFPQEREG
jgi:hypothetical protein